MPIQRTIRLATFGACGLLSVVLAGCGDDARAVARTPDDAPPATAPQPEAPARTDTARLIERAAARWDHKAAGDWIQVYGYASPTFRRMHKLGDFLPQKEHHVYQNPTRPMLLGIKDNRAFLEVTALWTPTHPILYTADNLADPDELTQELSVVETWVFEQGDWYWAREERQSEFFEDNPDLLPGGTATR